VKATRKAHIPVPQLLIADKPFTIGTIKKTLSIYQPPYHCTEGPQPLNSQLPAFLTAHLAFVPPNHYREIRHDFLT
jgi:hypothetical protein